MSRKLNCVISYKMNAVYRLVSCVILCVYNLCRSLNDIKDREICCYSVSCKERENIGKLFHASFLSVVNCTLDH